MKKWSLLVFTSIFSFSTWACPTCALAASFTPKTLLLSLIFAALPMGLMLYLGYRVYQEEMYKKSQRKNQRL